jgi:hypothetical protein
MSPKNRPAIHLTAAVAILCLFPITANADVSLFTDRTEWQTSAGATLYREDFNSITADRPFRRTDGRLRLNGFSLLELGPLSSSTLNQIDVPPFVNAFAPDINNTAFANIVVDFQRTSVELRFAEPTRAFGAEFAGVDSFERLNIEVFGVDNSLLISIDPRNTDGFYGFTAPSVEPAAYLVFRATRDGSNFFERFGMDDVEIGSGVPEPTGSAMFFVAILAYASSRRMLMAGTLQCTPTTARAC